MKEDSRFEIKKRKVEKNYLEWSLTFLSPTFPPLFLFFPPLYKVNNPETDLEKIRSLPARKTKNIDFFKF